MRPMRLPCGPRSWIAAGVLSAIAGAQCTVGWSEAFGSPFVEPPGFNGALGVFDDGTGARLYAGTTMTSTTLHGTVVQWNGVAWSPLPLIPTYVAPTLPPNATAFAVFDDGTGPALFVGFDASVTLTNGLSIGKVGRWNGTSWSSTGPTGGAPGPARDLCVFDDGSGPALYLAGPAGVSRWNGSSSWSYVAVGVDTYRLRVWDDGSGPALYAMGAFASIGGVGASNVARWNGTAWSAVGSGVSGGGIYGAARAGVGFDDGSGPALYVTGYFTTAGGVPANSIAKWNGAAWSPVGSGLANSGTYIPVGRGLTVLNDVTGSSLFVFGTFITAGGVPASGVARYQGGTWSAAGSGLGVAEGLAATIYDDGTGPALYAAATGAVGLARWNGADWSQLAGLGVQASSQLAGPSAVGWSQVLDLEVLDLGSGPTLFAGGDFSRIGGSIVSGIASFAQGQWHSMGSPGVFVKALTTFDDGTGPALYACGQISNLVGGVSRWNGTTWTVLPPLTGSVPDSVDALAVFDDGGGPRLIAGGLFVSAGGVPASSFAAWDGASWAPYGGVFPGFWVKSLIVGDMGAGPELFCAGQLWLTNGGLVLRRVGATWQVIGAPATPSTGGGPETLAIFDDGTGPALYAAGHFSHIGGQSMMGVAKWNGSTWSPAAPVGLTPAVNALAVYDDGTGPALYAGGAPFYTPGFGQPSTYFAKMIAPGVWAPVDGDFQGTVTPYNPPIVNALAVHDDGAGPALFAGGRFVSVSGVPSSGLARWGPVRPSLEVTQAGPGAPVTVRNSGLLKYHEYYNIFSDSLCPGPAGSGPLLGLCAPDPTLLLLEFGLPVGSLPIHFVAPVGTWTLGSYQLPPGLALDALCFDYSAGVLGCTSNVVRIVVQ